MRKLAIIAAMTWVLAAGWSVAGALAADSKVDEGARRVESGAKTVGTGISETAKGVGTTVVEGAKTAGDKLRDAGKAAEPQAKSAWDHVRDGAVSFEIGRASCRERV